MGVTEKSRGSKALSASARAVAAVVGAVALAAAPVVVSAPAVAAPAADAGPHLVSTTQKTPRVQAIEVFSPSMGRAIPLEVITPADTSSPRPVLYLMNGAGGGEDNASWQRRMDVEAFFADENVNVVTPMEGAFSYYTDWVADDPRRGRQKWQTFMLDELPPVIDQVYGTNGVQSVAAISMTATSVLNYAIAKPGFYRAVGSYSGCAETTTDLGRAGIDAVLAAGGAKRENMWGPVGGPEWVRNDPVVNAEGLRGTQLYVSTGTGLPGMHDTLAEPGVDGNGLVLANQVVVGGVLEAATHQCTVNLANKLDALGIPATFDFHPGGTHSWGYWRDDLRNSWPMIAASMGL